MKNIYLFCFHCENPLLLRGSLYTIFTKTYFFFFFKMLCDTLKSWLKMKIDNLSLDWSFFFLQKMLLDSQLFFDSNKKAEKKTFLRSLFVSIFTLTYFTCALRSYTIKCGRLFSLWFCFIFFFLSSFEFVVFWYLFFFFACLFR